ncbi:Crp/Fnr family transcriptional regulator [Muricoccus pecuniae]|uniref:CRP-like cAMP-binding protein n=1 Tax=Muricoccus pecuniae TaxID=693023 RepID=A0A840Y9I3_9PROT|nr:Crp/Fnr family transcriptional regulator [Roseomonas pecuniae]MBB5695379.1 CRP-like cAMP-binding protein [Roseomonas pecuniae]
MPPHSHPRNRLLAALGAQELAALAPHLVPVELSMRATLHLPGQPITEVFFPESGYVSMVAHIEDGDLAEVGLVGREGFIGLPILLGADREDIEAMVQSPGAALRMDAARFRDLLDGVPGLREILLRYALVYHGQVARTAACNGHHSVSQRLARWLLMAHDRSDGNSFPVTHELLSHMLAVRRAGVTVAAGQLRTAGLIRYEGGRIHITNRQGLESASCECYGIVRRSFDELLDGTARRKPGGS